MILRVEARGVHNVPRDGALIIAISHSSWIDPVVLGPNIPRYIASMAKAEVAEWPILGGIVRAYGAFFVRRGAADVGAFKIGLQVLKLGYAMGIAPEGHRSETGKLQRGREGAIILALRSGAPILPVAVWGGKWLWKNLAHLRRTEMKLFIGAPVRIVALNGKASREVIAELSDELMMLIARLMPPELHGYYEGKLREPKYLKPIQVTQEEKEVVKTVVSQQ